MENYVYINKLLTIQWLDKGSIFIKHIFNRLAKIDIIESAIRTSSVYWFYLESGIWFLFEEVFWTYIDMRKFLPIIKYALYTQHTLPIIR